MLHLGLLITKDDDEIIDEWFQKNATFFDGIVCLDGSESQTTRLAAARHENVLYVHEDKATVAFKTDHGLRSAAHELLVERFGANGWITLCHADEFFYHNPRLCCQQAHSQGCDGIVWYAVHFLPHPNDLLQWSMIQHLPVHKRFRYYHWDVAGNGLPWLEFRSYRNSHAVHWEPSRHGSTQPLGCIELARFHPAYRHFKVYSVDMDFYERDCDCTRFRRHWRQVTNGRTGVPWPVESIEDLFVAKLEPYLRCDYFREVFNQKWNIGEEFR